MKQQLLDGIDVAYILHRFPEMTETFIAGEIREVQSIGVKVQIFSLLPPRKELIHSVSAELSSHVIYVPEIFNPALWSAQLYFLRKSPVIYFRLLWDLLKQPSPHWSFYLKRLIIFFKAVWLAKHLQKSPVQLVHTHFAWLSAAASMIVSQLLDLPFTITTHAYDIYSQKNDLLVFTTDAADHIVTISDYNKQAILKKNRALDGRQIEVIHCGIDLERFQTSEKEPTDPVFQITSVGSLIEKKGHEYLILACKELETRGVNFHCEIIGKGNLYEELQKLIQNLKLEDKVTLVGAQTQTHVRDRLMNSDLFVLACIVTDTEGKDGIPVAIMEALAMGVPVVSTAVSGIPELIRHEKTGLAVPERDPLALAAAILRLNQDKPLSQKFARNGRSLVEKEFETSENVNQLTELFRRVIEERIKEDRELNFHS